MRNYTTTQGDMFDIVARRVYGAEDLMHIIIDANPDYRDTVVFPANCELLIPDKPEISPIDFPPWRANGNP